LKPELRDEWKKVFKDHEKLDKETKVKAMQFGAYVLAEAKLVGKQAFDQELPFKENSILEINISHFKKETGADEIIILSAEDGLKSDNKNIVSYSNNASPGKPQIMLE